MFTGDGWAIRKIEVGRIYHYSAVAVPPQVISNVASLLYRLWRVILSDVDGPLGFLLDIVGDISKKNHARVKWLRGDVKTRELIETIAEEIERALQ